MRLRFAPRFARQVDGIYLFIARDNPGAAQKVVERIYEIAEFVATHPGTGHATIVNGVRAIPVSPYPYVVYFRRAGENVRLLRVLHAARRRPALQEEAREFRV